MTATTTLDVYPDGLLAAVHFARDRRSLGGFVFEAKSIVQCVKHRNWWGIHKSFGGYIAQVPGVRDTVRFGWTQRAAIRRCRRNLARTTTLGAP